MKRVVSLLLFVLIIVGSLTVPAAATEANGTWLVPIPSVTNPADDATDEPIYENVALGRPYIYANSDSADAFFGPSAPDEDYKLLTDGVVRKLFQLTSGGAPIKTITTELAGTLREHYITIFLDGLNTIDKVVLDVARRGGNRYCNINKIEVSVKGGEFVPVTFTEEKVAIEGAGQHSIDDGVTNLDQFFTLNANFEAIADVTAVRVTLNTDISAAAEGEYAVTSRGYIVQLDEIMVMGTRTGDFEGRICSGTHGALEWELDAEGTLTISGEGDMNDVFSSDAWKQYSYLIKTVVIKDGVTSIGDYAFYSCTSLTSITIPNSVTSINNRAFRACTSLISITIPDSVTSIGWDAFYGCISLTSITIPNSVTSIGEGAFEGCTSLASIKVDLENTNYCDIDGVLYNKDKTTIIKYPEGNANTYYNIPNSVTRIDYGVFEGCTALTSITIPNSVTMIGNSAFYGCTSLTSITIPNSVTSIGGYAFYDCTSLTSIIIPDSVTFISNSAFCGCTSLMSITLSDSVTIIGWSAFESCTSLTSITIPNSITSIQSSTFSGCTSLASITIPDSVTGIGDYAFYRCTSLTSITIPDSVTGIGWWAFEECTSLTSVTIPDSTTSIGYYTFDGCTSLETVYYGGTEEEWQQISIDSGNESLENANIVFKPRYSKGDVNGDGEVDNLDAAMILKYDAGIIENVDEALADVNNDGASDNLDAAMILKYDAGIIESL